MRFGKCIQKIRYNTNEPVRKKKEKGNGYVTRIDPKMYNRPTKAQLIKRKIKSKLDIQMEQTREGKSQAKNRSQALGLRAQLKPAIT